MKLFTLGLLLALTLTMQDPPDHSGQPEYCVNHSDNAKYPRTPETACECIRTCKPDEPEDRNCKTYCRRPQCKCRHGCET
mgnify:CR=1 FL=1